MARIAGIDLPKNKRGEIGLTYIFGIGRSRAQRILTEANIDFNKKVNEWNDDEQNAIRKIVNDNFKVEGGLRSEVALHIKRLTDIDLSVVFATVWVYQFVDKEQKRMHVLVKVSVRQLQTRKKLLSNK